MIIVRNKTPHDVDIKLPVGHVTVKSRDEVLVDDVVGENLRELQPQLSYFNVPRAEEKEVEEMFKAKAKADAEAAKRAKAKEAKQIADMEKRRKEATEKKRKEREEKDKELLGADEPKKVAKKPVKANKITKKKHEKK